MQFKININGRSTICEAQPEDSLLEVLRRIGIYSVRSGCETGNCGVCTVWLNGTPVLSCSVPVARAEGQCVTTVEGVSEEAAALVEALSEEGADQCGYCAPGLIMAVLAMKRELSMPDEEGIAHYLNGNLCRCSGYRAQMRAIRKFLCAEK
ncbi:2Fe-2S iron-sulfur cluster-binding protein [bacterium]|nr:2Fe-2S iron-sulfur cluster-binding protein [bacterium]